MYHRARLNSSLVENWNISLGDMPRLNGPIRPELITPVGVSISLDGMLVHHRFASQLGLVTSLVLLGG
jgi:hypothetical protein